MQVIEKLSDVITIVCMNYIECNFTFNGYHTNISLVHYIRNLLCFISSGLPLRRCHGWKSCAEGDDPDVSDFTEENLKIFSLQTFDLEHGLNQ